MTLEQRRCVEDAWDAGYASGYSDGKEHMQSCVADFHDKFGLPRGRVDEYFGQLVPTEEYRGELRVALIQEELDELMEATREGNAVDMADAYCDLLYVVFGAAVELGIDLTELFDAVHEANMAKTGGGLRADGKVLKPEGWKPPDIESLVRSQL